MLVPPVEAKDRKRTGDPERVTIASFEDGKNYIEQYSERAACKSDLNHIQRKHAMPLNNEFIRQSRKDWSVIAK